MLYVASPSYAAFEVLGFFEKENEAVENDDENAEVVVLDSDVKSVDDTVVLVARAEVGEGGEEAWE